MRLILCDFDDTIYDTRALKAGWERKLEIVGINPSVFWKAYQEFYKGGEKGSTLEFLYEGLNRYQNGLGDKVKEIIDSYPYGEHLLPWAKEALEIMQSLGLVAFWTMGDKDFQKKKMDVCGFSETDAFISDDKIAELERILEEYKPDEVIIIDDREDILDSVLENATKIIVGRSERYRAFPNILDVAHYLSSIYRSI